MKKKIIFAAIFFIGVFLYAEEDFIYLNEIQLGAEFSAINSYLTSKGFNVADYKYIDEIKGNDYFYKGNYALIFDNYLILNISIVEVDNIIISVQYIFIGYPNTIETYKSFIFDYAMKNNLAVKEIEIEPKYEGIMVASYGTYTMDNCDYFFHVYTEENGTYFMSLTKFKY